MTTLLVCLEARGAKVCGGRVSWSRSSAGGFAGLCGRCHHHRRAVSGELPALAQLELDGKLAGLTPAESPGPLTQRPKGRSPDTR